MGVDYYKTLRVDRSASDDDLKKAYHKLAMKWHPDKNRTNMKEAEANFKQISEAYDTLSDPEKRKTYDLYGEEGLKGQAPSTSASGSGTRDRPSNKRSADDIFSEIFGKSSPFRGMADVGGPRGGSGHRGMFGENIFASFGSERGGGGDRNGTAASTPRKGPPIENTLACSLEELYKGSSKKLKISREVLDSIGRTTVEEIILTIDIKAGWKKGTKVMFPEKGNEQRNQIPSDLIFIVEEKPHAVFKREGNDLVVTQKITLLEALTGYTIQLTTLDGRSLIVPIDSIISPTHEEIVQGEGMPIAKEVSKKGNLRIRFQIKFPTTLSSEQKSGIKRALISS